MEYIPINLMVIFRASIKIGRTADMMFVTSLVATVYFIYCRFTTDIKSLVFEIVMAILAVMFTWVLIFDTLIAIPSLCCIYFFGGINNYINELINRRNQSRLLIIMNRMNQGCIYGKVVGIFYPLFVMLKNVKKVEVKDQVYLVSTLVASVAFLTTQVFH